MDGKWSRELHDAKPSLISIISIDYEHRFQKQTIYCVSIVLKNKIFWHETSTKSNNRFQFAFYWIQNSIKPSENRLVLG